MPCKSKTRPGIRFHVETLPFLCLALEMVQLEDVTQELSPAERAAGELAPTKAAALAASIAEHGFAVLDGDVCSAAALDAV